MHFEGLLFAPLTPLLRPQGASCDKSRRAKQPAGESYTPPEMERNIVEGGYRNSLPPYFPFVTAPGVALVAEGNDHNQSSDVAFAWSMILLAPAPRRM